MNSDTGEIREFDPTAEGRKKAIELGFDEQLEPDEVDFLREIPEHQRKKALDIYRAQKTKKVEEMKKKKPTKRLTYGAKSKDQKIRDKKKKKLAKASKKKNRKK